MRRPPFRPPRLLLALIALLPIFLFIMSRTRPQTLVIKLQGRLGNQLFQVAAAEYYASQHRLKPNILFLRNNYSAETDLSQGLFRDLPHADQSPCRETATIVEKRHSCEPVTYSGQCVLLDGFWQCPFYAKAGRSLINRILKSADRYHQARADMNALTNTTRPVVVVHVRRGDYTKRFNKGLLEPLPRSYYHHAAQQMPSPATFMVFSDDPEWCRKYMGQVLDRGDDHVVVVEEKDNLKALVMMMTAKHFIIANSTFSWWAAFLAGSGVVVAPKQWFGERVGAVQKILPKRWIVV